jgi:hypothetical protein
MKERKPNITGRVGLILCGGQGVGDGKGNVDG